VRGQLRCSHDTSGPASWASPQQAQARESSAERWLLMGRFNKPQAGTNFCPNPPQLGPADRLTHCKTSTQASTPATNEMGRNGEWVNSSTLFALLKVFL